MIPVMVSVCPISKYLERKDGYMELVPVSFLPSCYCLTRGYDLTGMNRVLLSLLKKKKTKKKNTLVEQWTSRKTCKTGKRSFYKGGVGMAHRLCIFLHDWINKILAMRG